MLVDMDYVGPQFGDQSRLGPNGAEVSATGNCRQDPGLGPSPTAGDVSYDLCKGTDDGSLKRRPKASEKVTSDTLPPTYDWGIGVEKKSHLTPAPTAESGTSGFESSVRVARYAPGVARGISCFETRWFIGRRERPWPETRELVGRYLAVPRPILSDPSITLVFGCRSRKKATYLIRIGSLLPPATRLVTQHSSAG